MLYAALLKDWSSHLYSQRRSSFFSSTVLRRWAKKKLISDTAQMPGCARGPSWGRKRWHIPKLSIRALPLALAHHPRWGKAAAIMLSYFPQSAPLTHAPLAASQPLCLFLSNLVYLLVLLLFWHPHKWIITSPSRAEMFLNCTDITSAVFHIKHRHTHMHTHTINGWKGVYVCVCVCGGGGGHIVLQLACLAGVCPVNAAQCLKCVRVLPPLIVFLLSHVLPV